MKRKLAVFFITALLLALAAGILTAHAADAPKSSGAFVKPTATAAPEATAKPTARPTAKPTSKPTAKPAAKPSSVKIDGKRTIDLKVGKTLQLKAVVKPSGASTKLTWKSSKPKIVKVSKDGKLTALDLGAATITVKTANGKKASVKVVTSMSGKCGEKVSWNLDGNGLMTISGKGKMYDFIDEEDDFKEKSKKIREVVIKKGVTRVGSDAFYDCPNLKKATIASSVREIGSYAFQKCTGLTTVKLSKGLKTIEDDAFYSCTSLKSLDLPAGVRTLGYAAFEYCESLTGVTLRKGLKVIGSSAFEGCRLQKDVKIPSGVTTIGSFAFYDCSSLKTLTIPASAVHIGILVGDDYSDSDSEYSLFSFDEGITIRGYKGSAAEKFAKDQDIRFKAIG